MKKTITRPIIGGLILGVLSFMISVANITVQISADIILGPWEILNTISAALFGPIGLLITQLGMDIGGYLYLVKGTFPAPQDLHFMIGDFIAHSTSSFVVAYCYRFIHRRMKMPQLLLGWILIMAVYYVMEIVLAVTLFRIAVPVLETTYATAFNSVRIEFPLVTAITCLILMALPDRYRRPQWFEPKITPEP